ncbi:hypothetical protein AAC387_Pa02g0919 [Persea americana]
MLKGTKKPQFDCGELSDPMWMKQQLRILVQQGLGVLYVDKGRPKRLKSSRKKAQKKDRLCRGCNQRGVSHDKRNCPALLNR